MRVGLYARYSSSNQSETSVEDQLRLLQERCAAEGWQVVDEWSDCAKSAAHTVNRQGFNDMMVAVRAGQVDMILAESLDRLSRNMRDTAGLYEELVFLGIKLVTLSEGEVGEIDVGLRGTMNALFLKDVAAKVRRGQRGRVEAGRIPGGICYGYNPVRMFGEDGKPVAGLREIDQDQAMVVRRIFSAYLDGKSARAIAAELNAEGVPAPRGGLWNASTINGNRKRANGILHNRLYIGEICYNRQTFRKDPSTALRQARPNRQADWIVAKVPHLAIVDQSTWDAVQARKAASPAKPPHQHRRPKRLLSGLIKCGVCGGGMTIVNRGRLGCSTYREKGACDNNHTVLARIIEDRVLDGLRQHLLAPDVIADVVRQYHAELMERRASANQNRRRSQRRLAEIDRRLTRLVEAISEGTDTPTMREAVVQLEAEKSEIGQTLKALCDSPVIELHSGIAEDYRRKIETLHKALREDSRREEAASILRSQIARIVLKPGENRGEWNVDLVGRLAAALTLGNTHLMAGSAGDKRVPLMMVAGVGFEPTTFRL